MCAVTNVAGENETRRKLAALTNTLTALVGLLVLGFPVTPATIRTTRIARRRRFISGSFSPYYTAKLSSRGSGERSELSIHRLRLSCYIFERRVIADDGIA